MVAHVKPKYFEWERNLDVNKPTVLTHRTAYLHGSFNSRKYLILWESTELLRDILPTPKIFEFAPNFDKIFTHNSSVLQLPNTRWIPGGGIWIGGYGGGEVKIYDKTKDISLVSSTKNMCELHRYRLALCKILDVDIMGTVVGKPVKIIESLADYKYSIIIENNIDDLYFTEKLLNCFATGTIPIYLGARSIATIFNKCGIISINDLGLDRALELATEEYYYDNFGAVQDNFERCQKFRCIEDYIWENYKEDFQ